MKDFVLAVGQWPVVEEKAPNLSRAREFIENAAGAGAELCVLPEMFQTPYELQRLRASAEHADGPTLECLRAAARDCGVYVVGGSFCERAVDADGQERVFNTSYVLDDGGEILGRHRKIHLFDVDLETVRVKESLVFTPGEAPLVVQTPFCCLGVAVCYDVRFPAIFAAFEDRGVEVVALPAAFSQTTGEAHWHFVMRSRAVDYQLYLAAACPAPNHDSSYVAYGHSLIADPWGNLLAEAGEGDEWFAVELSAEVEERVRRELPLLKHRRKDLYAGWGR